jgi:hypothetical protein
MLARKLKRELGDELHDVISGRSFSSVPPERLIQMKGEGGSAVWWCEVPL